MLFAFLVASALPLTCALESICRSCEAINNNITFLTPNNSELPGGTYIAINSTGITQLADYLDNHPDAFIKNLLLSDSTFEDLANDFGYFDTSYDRLNPPDEARWEKYRRMHAANQELSQTLRQHALDLEQRVKRIIDRVAPTLESLVLLNYLRLDEGQFYNWDDNRTRTALDHNFPQLTHLTIRDYHWDFKPLPGQRWRFFPPLPSVTHLHIVADANAFSGRYPSSSTLRRLVPNGQRIRLSGYPAKEFHPKLWKVVRWSRQIFQAILDWNPRKTIIVQPNYSPRGGYCGNPGIQHGCMLAQLAWNPAIRVLLPHEEDYNHYGVSYAAARLFSLRRALAEFEGRLVDGGEGEWDIPSLDETSEQRRSSLRYCS
ncbi:hypothetical protein MIND_00536400 [Mycena indigotica]|uniref:Uncharacterized protein n=1 Tax=Mycena indigotica TaxID=2126181 RepID=A0A8H6T0V7_9AGAR|nr:uncharacterized protein MIND_00536400 [Mycena indigotica]KAF7307420.1 hypothetical protein MIND_00536400 [Mycena indigotica]